MQLKKDRDVCSDPQNYLNKETGEIKQGACRRCDECIATRRHGWVARAMAEKTGFSHTLIVALTYSDATPEGRDGARMFCYADVRAFLARLRDAAWQAAKKQKLPRPVIRFLCAGEQGDRNGRCHWHLVLYSDCDLTQIGAIKRILNGKKQAVTDKALMLTVGQHEVRLDWSMWAVNGVPLGFVTFQEADQGGMNYVLSYCLKDQFTEEKSRNTARHASAENFATGLFRMSKRPAIGEDFIMRKMEVLAASGAVLPKIHIKIPGFRGYWHPSGTLREKLLWGLVALNQRAKWATGRNAPQWASLLSSVSEDENATEILVRAGEFNEEWENEPKTATATAIETLRRRAKYAAEQKRDREWRQRKAYLLSESDTRRAS